MIRGWVIAFSLLALSGLVAMGFANAAWQRYRIGAKSFLLLYLSGLATLLTGAIAALTTLLFSIDSGGGGG